MKLRRYAIVLSSMLMLAACDENNQEAEQSADPDQVESEAVIEEETDQGNGDEAEGEDSSEDQSQAEPEEDKEDISDQSFYGHISEFTPIIRNETSQSNYNISEVEYTQEAGEEFYLVRTWDGAYHFEYEIDPGLSQVTVLNEENNIEPLGVVDSIEAVQPNNAMQVAIENSDGSEVYSWRLYEDEENEMVLYEFETEGGAVNVDAETGELVE